MTQAATLVYNRLLNTAEQALCANATYMHVTLNVRARRTMKGVSPGLQLRWALLSLNYLIDVSDLDLDEACILTT